MTLTTAWAPLAHQEPHTQLLQQLHKTQLRKQRANKDNAFFLSLSFYPYLPMCVCALLEVRWHNEQRECLAREQLEPEDSRAVEDKIYVYVVVL